MFIGNEKRKGKSYFETKRTSAPGWIRTLTLNGEIQQKIPKIAGDRSCQIITFSIAVFSFTTICCKLATLSGFKISSISFNWFWSQVAATCCSMKKTSLKKPILLSEIHPIWILSQYQLTLRSKSDLFLEQKLTDTLYLIKKIHHILV